MSELELEEGDAALVLHSEGGVTIVLPKLHDDDEVPEHVAIITAIAMGLQDDNFLENLRKYIDGIPTTLN